jgi:hypothetical protein
MERLSATDRMRSVTQLQSSSTNVCTLVTDLQLEVTVLLWTCATTAPSRRRPLRARYTAPMLLTVTVPSVRRL